MRVLAVLSHPDDELFCLGSLCRLGEAGVGITALFVTSGDGDRKVDGFLRQDETRSQARERETRNAARYWPVEQVLFERLKDERESDQQHIHEALSLRLAELLASDAYDIVITHGSDGEYGHPCHIAVNKTVADTVADRFPAVAVLTFNACDIGLRLWRQINMQDPAHIVVDVRRYSQVRLAVLDSYASQKERFRPYIDRDDIDSDLAILMRLHDRETFGVAHAPVSAAVLEQLFADDACGRTRLAANKLLCLLSRTSAIPLRLLAKLNRLCVPTTEVR